MTFSICASVNGRHGVAVATHAIGVGSTAPFVCRRGAVCTQAMTSTPLGVRTICRLADGEHVDDAVSSLIEADPHATHRQIHGVDADGTTVARTGSACEDVAEDFEGDRYTIAGNMLEDADVIEAMAAAFEAKSEVDLDERLIAVLQAGDAAGGDKRGANAMSAAVTVFDSEDPHLAHDVRVDEHEDAVAELTRIHEVAKRVGSEWAKEYPKADLQRHP